MKKFYIGIVFIFTLILISCSASQAMRLGAEGTYIWTPLDSFTSATGTIFYCRNANIRKLYAKDFGAEPMLEAAYKNGNCTEVTTTKTIKTSGYECIGLFSDTKFLDLYFCRVYPKSDKELQSKGWTDEQFDRFFQNNEQSLMQEFKSGKGQ